MVGRVLGIGVPMLVATVASAQAQQKTTFPPSGFTPAAITEGDNRVDGPGRCMACHGQDAKGMPNMGADLTDQKWLHSKGTYDDIVKQVMTGVSAKESTNGTVMPPKGGGGMSDDQVKAVAAYVWSLSHKCK